jgi:hypothetical protein
MDPNEAREHLEMVDRILSHAEPPRDSRPWSWFLVVVGTGAALLDAGAQFGADRHGWAMSVAGATVMVAAYAYMIALTIAARRTAVRVSAAQARIGRASSAVWLAVFIAAFAQPHIFGEWAAGAIWSLGATIQMLMWGFFGDRRALAGGLILGASMIAANYVAKPGYALAAGFVFGYIVPALLMALDECEPSTRG